MLDWALSKRLDKGGVFMDRDTSLTNADYKLMDIVWDAEPVASPELCRLAEARLGWKRTTTYTVIKRLCQKGYLDNKSTIVTSRIAREEVGRAEGQQILQRNFKGSLPAFLAAFLENDSISDKDADEIEKMIESYRRRK